MEYSGRTLRNGVIALYPPFMLPADSATRVSGGLCECTARGFMVLGDRR